ncbi:cellobiose dehydrogenase [Cordyceps militaris]|uniref:Cellobiose dehydrogenase n=1 Tax=Cordyceps militaris TaxID=73501 RepID=A0A2H4S6G5_CORMI|nr:cellobiose dehydrogenase [Cordyceps militaris]
MGLGHSFASAIALVALHSLGALAVSAPHCVGANSQVCFTWGVPSAAIQSGTGNVYFQLRAPATYAWAGLGIGSRMSGAQIFLMYKDGTGNVTLSTRTGTGHVMPQHTQRPAVALLAGSGVVDGQMIANVRCSDCAPSASLSAASGWLSAWKATGALSSQDVAARIDYHDDHAVFQIDLGQAALAEDENPFVASSGGSGGSSGGGTNDGTGSGGTGSGGGGGSIVSPGGGGSGSGVSPALRYGHGVLMMIVWVILYPAGALLMPLLGKWIFHAAFQTIAFLAMWAGLGLGYVMADQLGIFWQNTHTRLGIIVCALMFLQPILGALHHRSFKSAGRRGPLSHIHVWYGRALMILGIINGGLGLQLANAGMPFRTAYIVLSAVIAGSYFLAIPWLELRKAKSARNQPIGSPSRKGLAESAASGETSTDFVQELYLKELKAYKTPAVKENDSVGQVQTFSEPKTPKSPEEADLASSLQEYESMAVEIEGQDAAQQSGTPAVLPDWLEAETEEAPKH